MEERKKRVLNAIINDYIANVEPVGSRTITKKYDFGVSPATIRNEMSDLEEEGYIEQPHTSAGRIPSSKGYRYYVDNLMEKQQLSSSEMRQIRSFVNRDFSEMEEFMRSCCSMIAKLTNYTAIAAVPENGYGKVESIQLLGRSEHQVLLIILSSTGIIRHRMMELPLPIIPSELIALEQELNRNLAGQELRNINYNKLHDIMEQHQMQERFAAQALDLLEQVLSGESHQRIFTSGVKNILTQPEFRDVDKLQNVFSVLEQDSAMNDMLKAVSPANDVLTVAIGQEMPNQGMQDCSMVVANYFVNGERAGSISVLGPTRMSYGKTVSMMEKISFELGKAISDKNKKK